jgi:CubicO group peptidase (beta-lactamase class C family)
MGSGKSGSFFWRGAGREGNRKQQSVVRDGRSQAPSSMVRLRVWGRYAEKTVYQCEAGVMSEPWLRRMIAVLLLGLGCLSVNAQTVDPKSMEAFVHEEMARLQIPGLQLAIVQHGRIVFSSAYGISNVEDSVPVTTKTIFPVNSITKAFTGVAVMELAESGKLDLNAPVSTYLTGLPPAWQRITIRQLMTHTSGLPGRNPARSSKLAATYDFDVICLWCNV